MPVSDATRRLIRSSVSKNTRTAYASALRAFEQWLDDRPLTEALVADYLTERFEAGLAPSSIEMIVAAIKFAARLSGAPAPLGFLTDKTLDGIRREGRERGTGQVTGITFMEARFLAGQIAGKGVRGIRDAAIIMLMSDCLLRPSELVAVRPKDISPVPDGTGRLLIPRSKTDQEGDTATQFVDAPTMVRVRDWIDEIQVQYGAVDAAAPLFRGIRKGGKIQAGGLSTQGMRKNLKAYAAQLGLKGRFSGHSFRVGTAQSLVRRGATITQMKTVGRWKSARMPAVYCRNELAGKSAVATLLCGRGEPPDA